MISNAMPVSSFTRERNSFPLLALRQASVATHRQRFTRRAFIFDTQTPMASMAAFIDSSLNLPVAVRP